jgi:uncharacterized protein YjaG (DUF416 family)
MMINIIKKLHVKHRILKEQQKQFHLNHRYDRKIKSWRFVGYRCIFCSRMMRNTEMVDRHSNNCPQLKNYKRRMEKPRETPTIVTIDRKVWEPLETNQKFSE